MSSQIGTNEHIGILIATTVSVYHNGFKVASIDINLLPPIAPISSHVIDRVVTVEGLKVTEPGASGVALTVNTTETTSASATFVVGYSPVATFTREVSVKDKTNTGEFVTA